MKPDTLHGDIARCVDALTKITESVENCGRVIAECIDRNPGFSAALITAVPGLSKTLVNRLERVGRGTLDPRIALGIEHGIFAEKLPLEAQMQIIDTGVEVAFGPQGADSMVLKLEQMDYQTVSRVIKGNAIASLPHQRSEIMSREISDRRYQNEVMNEAKKSKVKRDRMIEKMPVVFDKKRKTVTITANTRLNLASLYIIIDELEGR